MELFTTLLIGFIAIEHIGFLVLEMFLWTTPIGLKTFGRPLQIAEDSKVLAANQGLYNGFLAAGLLWSLMPGHAEGQAIRLFFLGCVVVAGIYGGLTAARKILFIQGIPGALAFALVWFSK